MLLAVAVEREVLDGDVGDVLAGEEREQRRARSRSPISQKFSRSGRSSLKRLPARATSVRLSTFAAAVVRVLRPQADAVADPKAAAVGERDLLVVPVAVGGQLRGDATAP